MPQNKINISLRYYIPVQQHSSSTTKSSFFVINLDIAFFGTSFVSVCSNYNQMQSTSNKLPNDVFMEESKSKYFQMGIDFKTQGDLAIAMSILFALQKEVIDTFDAIDRQPRIPSEPLANKQLERCLKCVERNHELMLKVLCIKQELVSRMYMNRLPCKANEVKMNGMLAEIRKTKLNIKDKLNELEIRRVAIKKRQRPFEDQCQLEDEDLHILRNGLEVLQKETFDLWSQLSAYSLPYKQLPCD